MALWSGRRSRSLPLVDTLRDVLCRQGRVLLVGINPAPTNVSTNEVDRNLSDLKRLIGRS